LHLDPQNRLIGVSDLQWWLVVVVMVEEEEEEEEMVAKKTKNHQP
jgi:hypothetical protein